MFGLRRGLKRVARLGLTGAGVDLDALLYGRRPAMRDYPRPVLQGGAGNLAIGEILRDGRPCLVTRLGNSEVHIANYWMRCRARLPRPLRPDYRSAMVEQIRMNAGFFPTDARSLDRFSALYFDSLKQADVLGIWSLPNEHVLVRDLCPKAQLVGLGSLDSMIYEDPWSAELAGKRVLVLHPFAASIERQYHQHRKRLFKDPKVLPAFDLTTVQAVQSILGRPTRFATWFDAYDHMCQEIQSASFDIAIIGAGAYGLPLGAYVKSLGKQAVHMGGATQLLFGIRGRRWEVEGGEPYRRLANDSWVRPSAEETPAGHETIDDSAYW